MMGVELYVFEASEQNPVLIFVRFVSLLQNSTNFGHSDHFLVNMIMLTFPAFKNTESTILLLLINKHFK